jgi:hypothetical protein
MSNPHPQIAAMTEYSKEEDRRNSLSGLAGRLCAVFAEAAVSMGRGTMAQAITEEADLRTLVLFFEEQAKEPGAVFEAIHDIANAIRGRGLKP